MKVNESNIVCRVDELNGFKKDNITLCDNKLVLIDKSKNGVIESPEIETKEFDECVGSFACITDKNSLATLEISIKVNGKYSKYFSYGAWGLGSSNLYYEQDDTYSYMHVDEILTKEGYNATGVKFRITLTNDAKLSIVNVILRIKDYKVSLDTSNLPKKVYYEVPKLNQNMVPVIGHEMCSATTSCMLLMYKGFDFSKYDEFPHRYIANFVADNGHNDPTYGNWSFNIFTIGAYGVDTYLKRIYSWDEIKWHLANVGPFGASIGGDTGLYKTAGHLLVVVGYKETSEGTYVLCNDPNINDRFGKDNMGNPLFVYYEYKLETFMNFFKKGVMYVVE